MSKHNFPDGFVWGIATSAQQIEGGARKGGRGESIWDRFAATPGKIADGSTPEVACDHYHRWREDVELMDSLGIGAYRFSISWPRVLPEGRGSVNETGLDFYESLVDSLLERGIKPFITLYHWDLPQALQDRGGWAERATVEAFSEYTAAVAGRLGDRVEHWITQNEPWCIAHLGHERGHHAPGHKDPFESLTVAHHVLLAHGEAVGVLRESIHSAKAGIVLNLVPAMPASSSRADQEAARRFDGFLNRWYLDPLFRSSYPRDGVEDRIRCGHLRNLELPFVKAGDMEKIAIPIDFLGVNYYSRIVVRADDDGEPVAVPMVPKEELTDMGWEVYSHGLYDLLVRLNREYNPPKIYITENGAAYSDGPDPTGRIKDVKRVEYLHMHLLAAHRALTDGIPLKGYFVWSLLDNFEWAHGYDKRFGLYWVDFETQERIAKDSAYWYRHVVSANEIDDVGKHSF
jgi:beta-glucosidase